jgi:hypothetical protein
MQCVTDEARLPIEAGERGDLPVRRNTSARDAAHDGENALVRRGSGSTRPHAHQTNPAARGT